MTDTCNVHPLPGVVLDLEPIRLPPAREALLSALNANFQDVTIVGRTCDGAIHVFASHEDADKASGLLMRGVSSVAGAEQVHSTTGESA